MVLFRDFITLYVTVGIKFYSLWIITNVIASVFVYDVTVYSKSLASRHVGGTNRRCFEVIFVNWVKKYDYQNSIGLQSVLGVQNNFSTYFFGKEVARLLQTFFTHTKVVLMVRSNYRMLFYLDTT